jgi:predicted transposase YdaD
MAKYDELVKQLGRLCPKDFVRWLCPQVGEIQSISFEDREFEFTYRRVDLLYKVTTGSGEEFLFHLEFQAELKSDFLLRIQEYSTRIRREFGLPVNTVVVFLISTPEIRQLKAVDRCKIGNKTVSLFRYTKIILPREDYRKLIEKELPALLPLIPFAKIPKGEEEQALRKAAASIEAISEKNLRAELAAVLYFLSGYRYSGILKKIVGEKLMKDLMESVTYREAVELERRTTKLAALTKILRKRFGNLISGLEEHLRTIESPEKLDSLIDLALDCSSLEEFKAQVKE